MSANESFFKTPSDSGAVDIATAHQIAQQRPSMETSRPNERTFQPKQTSEPEPEPKREQQADPMMLQTLQTLNETVKQQGQMIQQLSQASNPAAQAQAMAQFEQARQQQQDYLQRFRPPDKPDLDDIITDGEALDSYIQQSRDWALQVARAEYAPIAQRMEALETLAAPILDEGRQRAWEKAASKLKSRGHSEESIQKMQDLANRVGQASYGHDFTQHQRFLMNPEAMAYAAEAAWDQGGGRMPVRGDSPPTGPPESASSKSGDGSGGTSRSNPMVSQVESRLGIKFSKDSLQKLDRYMKEK